MKGRETGVSQEGERLVRAPCFVDVGLILCGLPSWRALRFFALVGVEADDERLDVNVSPRSLQVTTNYPSTSVVASFVSLRSLL